MTIVDCIESLPIPSELCQSIHFKALCRLMTGWVDGDIPEIIDSEALLMARKSFGTNILFFHPDHIDSVFQSTTMGDFLEAETLYCSKFMRSPRMVWSIINKRRETIGKNKISYESIWAICSYLSDLRQTKTSVMVTNEPTEWILIEVYLPIKIYVENQPRASVIICLIDAQQNDVIAFRVTDKQQIDHIIPLVIYDAIILRRKPSDESKDGLLWELPSGLIVEKDLSSNCIETLHHIGIHINPSPVPNLDIIKSIKSNWTRDLRGLKLTSNQLSRVFNNYLNNAHGINPVKRLKAKNHMFRSKIGYQRDPAYVLPALRGLLPKFETVISRNGIIEFSGFEYQDELLQYWRGTTVSVCRFESTKSLWVYLAGEILCSAAVKSKIRNQSPRDQM